jgi:hypothetical protein
VWNGSSCWGSVTQSYRVSRIAFITFWRILYSSLLGKLTVTQLFYRTVHLGGSTRCPDTECRTKMKGVEQRTCMDLHTAHMEQQQTRRKQEMPVKYWMETLGGPKHWEDDGLYRSHGRSLHWRTSLERRFWLAGDSQQTRLRPLRNSANWEWPRAVLRHPRTRFDPRDPPICCTNSIV